MDLKGKKVTVVGLGRSGQAACNLLIAQGAQVSVSETQPRFRVQKYLDGLEQNKLIKIETGRHTEELISGQDLIVVSPGVALDAAPVLWAKQKGIPLIGEIELAFRFCPAPIIAVTGTNGKSTVTTLLGKIFTNAGKKALVCGNIGTAFSGQVSVLSKQDLVILETSSFQLETIEKFRPQVALVLNFTLDHLDRHQSLEQYFLAKCRIFLNQKPQDWAVLNSQDPYVVKMARNTEAQVVYFSSAKLKGHLLPANSNFAAAITVSSLLGVGEQVAVDTCRNFPGLEHRLEQVLDINGVQFINDSKATNADSTLWALKTIKKPIILIAGGKDKGSEFSAITERVREQVRAMVLLGEAQQKLAQAFDQIVLTKNARTLAEAVRLAFGLAREGDCVLLSPMCASFDMFTDYAERGRVFKQAVHNLLKPKTQGPKHKQSTDTQSPKHKLKKSFDVWAL